MMSALNVPSLHDTGQRKSRALMSVLQADEGDETVDVLVDKIVEIAEEVLDSERVLLFFVGTAGQDLFTLTGPATGPQPWSTSAPLILPLDRGIPGYVARSGRLHNTARASLDPYHDAALDQRLGMTVRTCLCIPIVNSAGNVYAVLQAINKRRPGEDDEDDALRRHQHQQPGGDGMREEHKEADDGDADDAAVYTEDDEEIGTAFCVGVGSTLKRRLTEVVMWRSRRGGDGGDKQIQSMLEIYGNSSSSAASSRPAMGGYGGGRMEQGKRRSLGTSSFTSAMIASIYHPIPEASPLQPSLSEGAPLTAADNRRATWSRTMSTPFKGRRVPVSTADLSHTTDLSVIGLAAGAGAAAPTAAVPGGKAEEGAVGGSRQGVGSSAYTLLSNGAWMSPRGSRKGGLVASHSASSLYSTLPLHARGALQQSQVPQSPLMPSSITTYSPSPLSSLPRGAGVAPALPSLSPSLSTASLPTSASPIPSSQPSPAFYPSATTISFSSAPSSPVFPPLADSSSAVFRGASSHTSPAVSASSSAPSLISVAFSSLDSSTALADASSLFSPASSTSSSVAPSRSASSPARFAAPWAAFDSAREDDGSGAVMCSTASSTGSSPGFSSSSSADAAQLRSSFSLASPTLLVDGLSSAAAPSATSMAEASDASLSSAEEAAKQSVADDAVPLLNHGAELESSTGSSLLAALAEPSSSATSSPSSTTGPRPSALSCCWPQCRPALRWCGRRCCRRFCPTCRSCAPSPSTRSTTRTTRCCTAACSCCRTWT